MATYSAEPSYERQGAKRGYDDGGHDTMKRARYDDDAALGPDGKRLHTDTSAAIIGSETVYRLLVPAKKVGGVIGKGGAIVKQVREETGARIRVVEPIPNCDERVIVISAPNLPDRRTHAAQDALNKVHVRVHEHMDGDPGMQAQPNNLITRMLVCHTQAGSIIGKAGSIIKEIRESSGAFIKILPAEELPACALANDRVVQISGNVDALGRALVMVSRQIRENPPKEKPGGAPPQIAAMLAGAPPPGYGAPPPAYGAPVAAGYR